MDDESIDVVGDQTPSPLQSRHRWVPVAVLAGLLAIGLGVVIYENRPGGGGGSHTMLVGIASHAFIGTTGPAVKADGSQCSSSYGDSYVHSGAPVVVYDGGGKVIATGALGTGSQKGMSCFFSTNISVPEKDFYSVEVGGHGRTTSSLAEIESSGWTVGLYTT